jgi:hypothetical protein
MKDAADNMTPEFPEVSVTVTKKRGRPATGKAMTAAQRKAEQRKRDREAVFKKVLIDSHEKWTKKDCLIVLCDSHMSLEMQRAAVRQLSALLNE